MRINIKHIVITGITAFFGLGIQTATAQDPEFTQFYANPLYLNPARQEAYYNYILALQPKRVIFNPGTENEEFITLLKEHGIEVELACTLVLLATNQYS